MIIDINTLEKATAAVFEHLREQGVNSVELEDDFYWDIDIGQRYQPYKEPTQLNLGQLGENWKEIEKMVKGDTEVIGYAFVWVSTLCRYIGEENPG